MLWNKDKRLNICHVHTNKINILKPYELSEAVFGTVVL